MSEAASTTGWASLFWHAFDGSANPMALLRADRVLVSVNPALVDHLGYTADEVVGRRSDLFVAPQWMARLDRDWARLLRAGRLTAERELVRADGKHVKVQFAAHREQITGQELILYVVLDTKLSPIPFGPRRSTGEPLTPREVEVIGEIAMGRRWHEIAADLFISQSTVKTHVRNAMRKLGAHSQAQVVAIAVANGMLDPARFDGDISTR